MEGNLRCMKWEDPSADPSVPSKSVSMPSQRPLRSKKKTKRRVRDICNITHTQRADNNTLRREDSTKSIPFAFSLDSSKFRRRINKGGRERKM